MQARVPASPTAGHNLHARRRPTRKVHSAELIVWHVQMYGPTAFFKAGAAQRARKLFCMSRVYRLANSKYHAIELVSRSSRVSPHATLQRAGTLAPGLL